MNALYFVMFAVAINTILFLGIIKFKTTALYSFAIGGVVNANLFNSVTHPINCFGLEFGIDSIIYTMFVFCVALMFIERDKKEAYVLGFSAVVAIVISAFMQLFSELLSFGGGLETWLAFFNFMASSVASVMAIVVMIEVLNKLKGKINNYLLIIIGILIATVLNTVIYYTFNVLINGAPIGMWLILLTYFIGTIFALMLSLLVFYVYKILDNKKNII